MGMGSLLWKPEIVQAGVYDNAYTYYQTYGDEMRFLPGARNEGEIYYATKGKKSVSSGIRYTTVGWKVRVFNPQGALVDTVYYKLGGNHMTAVNVCTVAGYEYCLYRITLENLKSRLSLAGLETLSHSDCNIVFDACISIRKNGVVQGGMTDAGPSWGEVYTTYNGIVHAAPWTAATKESLHSYYNKVVEDLFYEVTLRKGTGIRQVSGAGRYCFGTIVNVQAECEEGYHFSNWKGSMDTETQNYSFVLYANDVNLTANATENSYNICFDSGGGTGYIPEQKVSYHAKVLLPTSGISKENAALSAWKITEERYTDVYRPGQEIGLSEIVKSLGLENMDGAEIVFHASWDVGPMIQTKEIFVSLEDALNGKITESWLAQKASAHDLEDGEIPYGKNESTSFIMENFQSSDFAAIREEGSVKKTFLATDSARNTTRKDILIHIVDTKVYPKEDVFGRVRFISSKYFWDKNKNLISEEKGGLSNRSIWRWDENYRNLLEKLFQLKGENEYAK